MKKGLTLLFIVIVQVCNGQTEALDALERQKNELNKLIDARINYIENFANSLRRKAALTEYSPHRKYLQNYIQRDINILNRFKNGKVYILNNSYKPQASAYKSEISYFVAYDNRYLIVNIPDKSIVSRLNKNTVKFTSNDARIMGRGTDLAVVVPKLKTTTGERNYTFLPLQPEKGQIIGGEADNLALPEGFNSYLKQDFYYFFVENQTIVLSKDNYINDKDIRQNGGLTFSTPIIETGTLSKHVDFNLIENESTKNNLEKAFVTHKKKTTFSDNTVLSISLKPRAEQNILGVHKQIKYSPDSDKLSKATIYENGAVTGRVKVQYFNPTYLKVNYFRRGTPGNSVAELCQENVLIALIEQKEELLLTKEEFDVLYNDFTGTTSVSDKSYDLIKSISNGRHKTTNLSGRDWNQTIYQTVPKDDPMLGTFAEWKDAISIASNRYKYSEYNIAQRWGSVGGFNQIAWDLFEMSDDQEVLEIARKFAARSVEMHADFYNLDTYARIMYKLGERKKALELINEAIAIAENRNDPYYSPDQNKLAESIQSFKEFRDELMAN